ncbi:hypothetical protein RRG08_044565, partial [Elysia crispata]
LEGGALRLLEAKEAQSASFAISLSHPLMEGVLQEFWASEGFAGSCQGCFAIDLWANPLMIGVLEGNVAPKNPPPRFAASFTLWLRSKVPNPPAKPRNTWTMLAFPRKGIILPKGERKIHREPPPETTFTAREGFDNMPKNLDKPLQKKQRNSLRGSDNIPLKEPLLGGVSKGFNLTWWKPLVAPQVIGGATISAERILPALMVAPRRPPPGGGDYYRLSKSPFVETLRSQVGDFNSPEQSNQ